MKKLFVLSLAVVLCIPLSVYAASIGGAETQGKSNVALGLDTSYIFERDLEVKSGLASDEEYKNLSTDEGYQIMFKTSYGLLDNLDVYAKLGAADYEISGDGYTSGVKSVEDKFNSDTDFAYGLGLKGVYEVGSDWLLGFDLQYLKSEHEAKLSEINASTGASSSTTYKKAVFQDWHVAGYVGYKSGDFVPYLGVRYSELEAELKSPSDSGWHDNLKFEADDNFGVFVGTDYKVSENCSLNVEGRFIDETAVSTGLTWKF